MTTALRQAIAGNLRTVRGRIAAAAERAGRDPAGVRLIAVSKTFPVETIAEAIRAGVTDLGENRVQEGAEKAPAVAAAGLAPTWHLIGHLQSNKVKLALDHFSVIHSIDSLDLAQRINRLTARRVDVLLEVNVGGEASKFGLTVDATPALAEAVARLANLNLIGLMTVAPLDMDVESVRPVFRQLRHLRDSLGLRELSMGMSADFEVAIEEGSTMVRIGRAIFGARDYSA